MVRVLVFSLLLVSSGAGTVAEANQNMRKFLISCAYGTGVGALVGMTAVTFSDQPTNNLQLVARGASLGLYVGMGIGYYLTQEPSFRYDQGPVSKNENLSFPIVAIDPSQAGVNLGYRFEIP